MTDRFIHSPIREQELMWMKENIDELSRYAGEWIVIEKDKLIVHHKEYEVAIKIANDNGINTPLIFYMDE